MLLHPNMGQVLPSSSSHGTVSMVREVDLEKCQIQIVSVSITSETKVASHAVVFRGVVLPSFPGG